MYALHRSFVGLDPKFLSLLRSVYSKISRHTGGDSENSSQPSHRFDYITVLNFGANKSLMHHDFFNIYIRLGIGN